MTTTELITNIFQVCIIPLLGVLTTFIVKWLNAKMGEIKATTDDVLLTKYMDMLAETITDCVIATNQTYVNALKQKNEFGIDAQKEAFSMTCNAVMAILSEDAKEYLQNAVGDLETYIVKKIEAEVNLNKTLIK